MADAWLNKKKEQLRQMGRLAVPGTRAREGWRKSAPPGCQEVEGKGGRGKSTILSNGLGFTDIPSKQLQTFTF